MNGPNRSLVETAPQVLLTTIFEAFRRLQALRRPKPTAHSGKPALRRPSR